MKKMNCWEYKRCGRGPNGKNDCPTGRDETLNGVHGGINAGRACWVVAGTGADAVSGSYALSLRDCLRCGFFRLVESDQQGSEAGFSATKLGMLKMLGNGKAAHQSDRAAAGDVDMSLRREFSAEVNKITTGSNGESRELAEEFAREVERLSREKE